MIEFQYCSTNADSSGRVQTLLWGSWADVVKEKKNEICNYLRELETKIGHEDYGECVEFVNKL